MNKLMDFIRNRGLMKIDRCLIWPKSRATVHEEGRLRIVKDSDRVGTPYLIDIHTQQTMDTEIQNDRDRAKLTTLLLDLNRQGVEVPEVTPVLINRAIYAPMLSIAERADRLLTFIGSKCYTIADAFYPGGYNNNALAWTESITGGEREYIWDYIRDEKKWIEEWEEIEDELADAPRYCVITPAGHARIAELSTRTDSAQAFVAMWFDDSMTDVYDNAVDPAIVDAGYDPFRIDREHFSDTITDKVIAEIRRSRFLVSDFTHGDDGVRGSVYYEAGFAHGLNIPVIFTAQEGTKPHFDTSTYPHIFWNPDNLPAFRDVLTNRILALKELGPGPRLP